jgi:hypothetical protein
MAEDPNTMNETTVFYMDALSTVWDANTLSYYSDPLDNWITTEFQNLSYEAINGDFISPEGFTNSISAAGGNSEIFGYGLYKLSVEDGTDFICLDFRDDRLSYYGDFGPVNGHFIDIWIKYVVISGAPNEFRVHNSGSNYSTGWIDIPLYSTVGLWELKGVGDALTDKFQPTDPSNLQISTSNAFHPLLTWTASAEPASVAKYDIYRSSGGSTYYKIASNLYATSYEDEAIIKTKFGSQTYYYKVRAVSGDGLIESNGYTNISTFSGVLSGGGTSKVVVHDNLTSIPSQFVLGNAYPNPFNPTVNLDYQLPNESRVSLCVYNVSGEIVYVVNKEQNEGDYAFHWNGHDNQGDSMPGGIYLVDFSATNKETGHTFHETHKVVYLK